MAPSELVHWLQTVVPAARSLGVASVAADGVQVAIALTDADLARFAPQAPQASTPDPQPDPTPAEHAAFGIVAVKREAA